MESKLIFVVDDDRIIQNLLEYTFNSRDGYKVEVFPSGEECIKNLEMKPDIIVLDHLFLNGENNSMSGMDTLIEIRKQDQIVPVIILSNQPNQEIVNSFFSNGATSYIPKEDYFVDNLIEAIEKV